MSGVCFWCGTDAEAAAKRHEGPHATWCPYYRRPEKIASDPREPLDKLAAAARTSVTQT